jgi:hypothetical protein
MNTPPNFDHSPTTETAVATKQPWSKPAMRQLSAKEAENGLLFGPEIAVLGS